MVDKLATRPKSLQSHRALHSITDGSIHQLTYRIHMPFESY